MFHTLGPVSNLSLVKRYSTSRTYHDFVVTLGLYGQFRVKEIVVCNVTIMSPQHQLSSNPNTKRFLVLKRLGKEDKIVEIHGKKMYLSRFGETRFVLSLLFIQAIKEFLLLMEVFIFIMIYLKRTLNLTSPPSL